MDDSELNREILATMLEEDFYILEATNGEEALLVLQQNPGYRAGAAGHCHAGQGWV